MKSKQNRGFVLLMTLFTLAIVGLLLVSLANHSLVTATDAVKIRKEVEHKWSQASCQRFALRNVEKFLTPKLPDEQTRIHLKENQFSVQLDESWFQVQLTDESAKLDINYVYANSSRQQATQTVRKFLPKNSELIVQLRPNRPEAVDAINRQFEGWGQVFMQVPVPNQPYFSAMESQDLDLTCWSQRINLKTASDDVLLQAVKLAAGSSIASELVNLRSKNPDESSSRLIAMTQATASQQAALQNLLSDRSWCQSISVRSSDPTSNKTTQLFRKFYTQDVFRIQSYSW